MLLLCNENKHNESNELWINKIQTNKDREADKL